MLFYQVFRYTHFSFLHVAIKNTGNMENNRKKCLLFFPKIIKLVISRCYI